MNYEQLKAIRNEVLRFDKILKKAMDEAILIDDVVYDGGSYNVGISGTHLSGAVKRKYLDMKYEINKIIKS